MHSFKIGLFVLAGLATAQDHVAVLGADGVSVGYHDDASSQAATPIHPDKTTPEVSYTSHSLPLHVPPNEVHDPAQSSAGSVAMQPVVAPAPTESSSPGQLGAGAGPSASGTAARADGRCGPKFGNAVCDPNGIYGGCCSSYGYCGITDEHCKPQSTSPNTPDVTAEAKPEYNIDGQPGADAAHPMGFWILNRNDVTQYISADWPEKDRGEYGAHEYLQFSTATVGPGESLWIPTLPHTSPKLYVGVSPNERTAEVGSHRNHDTLIEATFNGGYEHLYYDIDIERGFSSPVWCHGQGEPWQSGQGCVADLLAVCPEKDQHHNPATNVYDQCRASAENLQLRYQLCPKAYVVWNDDWNTNTTSQQDVLMCTIVSTPSSSKLQVAQIAEAERKEAAGFKANAVLPRRALPHAHSKHERLSGHA